jgi:hypothetical protein
MWGDRTPDMTLVMAAGGGRTAAASWRAAAAILFAASAASGLARKASDDGVKGSSRRGRDKLFCLHTLSSVATDSEMILESSVVRFAIIGWGFVVRL